MIRSIGESGLIFVVSSSRRLIVSRIVVRLITVGTSVKFCISIFVGR